MSDQDNLRVARQGWDAWNAHDPDSFVKLNTTRGVTDVRPVSETDAGVPHKIVHDFRRTALRDLVRAGVTSTSPCRSRAIAPPRSSGATTSSTSATRHAHRQVAVYRETRTETDNSKVVRL